MIAWKPLPRMQVVLCSWFGKKDIGLRLGTRFHRSHLTLVASQVSSIVGPHSARWSKARRFQVLHFTSKQSHTHIEHKYKHKKTNTQTCRHKHTYTHTRCAFFQE